MAQTPKPQNFKKPGNKRSNIVTIVVFVAIAIFFMTMISRMTAPANGISQTDQLVTSEFMQAVDQEQLLNYSDAAQVVRFQLVGSGAGLIDQEQIQYKGLSATAQDIATIARVCAQQQQWVSAEQALPVYLRDNAWKKIPEQGKA